MLLAEDYDATEQENYGRTQQHGPKVFVSVIATSEGIQTSHGDHVDVNPAQDTHYHEGHKGLCGEPSRIHGIPIVPSQILLGARVKVWYKGRRVFEDFQAC